ncbi:hypothetical protein Asera_34310 [Actinocatenispora sera]|uniref:DUF4878 domain-containing protein n=2 Tax=Actinocatenispora sera TaxID=390989 RepID=A0A810L1N6_9ACTN|nr:hypothetical protein Asera_34310 [Actinocatenispora sera]
MPPAGPPAPPSEPAGPPPPAGPGAVVPFTAAPRERNPRVWIGLGVVAFLVVLCCGGGIAGIFGYGTYQEHQISAAADKFLVALEDQQYAQAYRMQCQQARAQESEHEFVSRLDNQPRLESHQLSTPRQYQGNTVFEVPATLQYEGGQSRSLDVIVVGSSAGGGVGWQVCGTTG